VSLTSLIQYPNAKRRRPVDIRHLNRAGKQIPTNRSKEPFISVNF
jgi:hypothetical protein